MLMTDKNRACSFTDKPIFALLFPNEDTIKRNEFAFKKSMRRYNLFDKE